MLASLHLYFSLSNTLSLCLAMQTSGDILVNCTQIHQTVRKTTKYDSKSWKTQKIMLGSKEGPKD